MSVCAQSLQTIVKGVITDARSRETMPAVTITFWGDYHRYQYRQPGAL